MVDQTRRHRAVLCTLLCGFLVMGGAALAAEQSSTDRLIAATKSSDEATRLKAIDELGRDGAAAVPTLQGLLTDDSPVVRGYAARALGSIGAPAKPATEGLIKLLGDPVPGVRRLALAAIKAIRPGPKVSVPLFVKLMTDADPGIRMRVMEAVAEAKGAAVPALIEALKNPKADYWACLILRDIGPDASGAVPALLEKLKDPRPEIRREAVLALAAIGSPDVVPKLVPLLADEDARTAATYAMGVLNVIPPEADSTIRANVNSDDGLLATTSLWAMARVHPKDMKLQRAAITRLVARLKDQDPFVRTAAARALVALEPSPEIARPIFEKAVAEADEATMQYMLDALASLGPQAVPRLIAALQYETLRAQVAHILGQIGPPAAAATPALVKVLDDPDPNVRLAAVFALGKIGPGAKEAVPALVQLVKEPEKTSAHAAVYALGSIGPDAAAAEPALVELIDGLDNSLSLISAWALIQISGATADTAKKVLPELLAGLESSLPQSRATAAEALGSLGKLATGATTQLERAANDSNEQVRAAATKALASIRG